MLVIGQFNLEYFDRKLMKALFSTVYDNTFFTFENMNCLIEKDIKFLGLIFSGSYIDDDSIHLYKFSFSIYPSREYSFIKYKFKSIEALYKLMKTVSKEIAKNGVNINICKSILGDTDFMYLCRYQIWSNIMFRGWLIQHTKKMF